MVSNVIVYQLNEIKKGNPNKSLSALFRVQNALNINRAQLLGYSAICGRIFKSTL